MRCAGGWWRREGPDLKSEARNPKSEANPKSQIPIGGHRYRWLLRWQSPSMTPTRSEVPGFGIWDLGFGVWDFFRISGFGFRIYMRAAIE